LRSPPSGYNSRHPRHMRSTSSAKVAGSNGLARTPAAPIASYWLRSEG